MYLIYRYVIGLVKSQNAVQVFLSECACVYWRLYTGTVYNIIMVNQTSKVIILRYKIPRCLFTAIASINILVKLIVVT